MQCTFREYECAGWGKGFYDRTGKLKQGDGCQTVVLNLSLQLAALLFITALFT